MNAPIPLAEPLEVPFNVPLRPLRLFSQSNPQDPGLNAVERDWDARLPLEVVLGPYRLSAEITERSAMMDGRRRTCLNLERNRIELRQDLSGLKLASAFLESLIRLCHFSKGCQQGCVEESYAHSLATGLVEFAQRNPTTWRWLNLVLSKHLPGRWTEARAAFAAPAPPPPMPKQVRLRRHTVVVRTLSRHDCGNAFGWYDLSKREVQLCEGLADTHLSIVAFHEFTHAIHHAWKLEDHDLHDDFLLAQVTGWMQLIQTNPLAWGWLVWTVSQATRAP